jgi:hypothetical protein
MSFITRSSITRLPALAVLIALAAFVLLVVVGGSTAGATLSDGDVVLGASAPPTCTPGSDVNCETSATSVVNTSSGSDAFSAHTNGAASALVGFSSGSSTSFGVYGATDLGRGVYGQATGTGGVGVRALSSNGNGLNATALSSGSGVEGHSNSGIGVLGVGDSSSATALKAQGKSTFTGKTTFARSGKLTISAGTSSATKSPISLGSTALVLATIQGNQAGVYVQGVTQVAGSSGSFTIHLNTNTSVDLPVGWFVVN